jgi:predicted MPP superfamily phosphohydrolase
MKVFFASVFAQLLLTPYICYRGYQAIPARKSWRIPYVLFFAAELLLFFTGYFFHKELPDGVMVNILFVCGTWYIASLYITAGLLALELVRLAFNRLSRCPHRLKERWQKSKLTLFFLFVAGAFLLMAHAYRVAADPVVRHLHVELPKKSSTRDSLTVVMMSDLHIGEMIGKQRVRKFVSLANGQHPDLIVLVGDLMDYESRFAERYKAEEDLRMLEAPLGTYIVLGNHEYRANRHAKIRWLQKTGGRLLVDSVALPDSTFYLIGRDDYTNKKRKSLHRLMQDAYDDKPVIVLDHQPRTFTEAAMNGADLSLHGHTHNGQYWPYPLLMKYVFEKVYGYYRKGDTQFYVSSGIGAAGVPYRVGTVSELVVLHITFK